jgi:hypothetical protein
LRADWSWTLTCSCILSTRSSIDRRIRLVVPTVCLGLEPRTLTSSWRSEDDFLCFLWFFA